MGNQPIIMENKTASKPSIVQRRSFGSVKVAYLNKERAIAELTARAQALVGRDPHVIAVALFGSLARGEALPSSDADLLVILESHSLARWFDRISDYEDRFEDTALPAELFPYTQEELARMVEQPGMLRTAVRESMLLAGDRSSLERLKTLAR